MTHQWLAWRTEGVKVDRPNISFSGKWINSLGSDMTLEVGADGRLSGIYRTAVGAPGKYEEFEIIGYVNGDIISFTVNWGVFGSITAWVGQHTAEDGGGNERIETMWHLMKNVDEVSEKSSLWGAVLTGANVFRRA